MQSGLEGHTVLIDSALGLFCRATVRTVSPSSGLFHGSVFLIFLGTLHRTSPLPMWSSGNNMDMLSRFHLVTYLIFILLGCVSSGSVTVPLSVIAILSEESNRCFPLFNFTEPAVQLTLSPRA